MISVSNVSYRIGSKQILTDISCDIPAKGVTALVGPNGAGKSTLLGLIARLMPMQQGRVSVAGLDVAHTPSRDLARTLAILPQTSDIAPRLTVRELVGFGRYPHHRGRLGTDDIAKVTAALETLDLTELADRPLDSLSGGQRQRALLAMTFAQDTEYLLLDEPLNNLDIAASRSLMGILRMLAETHGRTIVIVLHDINYACAYADRIVTLKHGRLGPCGAPDDVVTDDMLRDVFETDARVIRDSGQIMVRV